MYNFFKHQSAIQLGIFLSTVVMNGLQPNIALTQALAPRSDRQPIDRIQSIGTEILPLKTQIQALMAQYQFLTPGVFLVDVETGNYVNLDGEKVFPAASRTQALDILNATENRKLLVAGLGKGAHIAHKTGDIGFLIGDAGIIEKPDGKLYLLAVFVRRPHNDLRARAFVQQLSRLTYSYLVPNSVARSRENLSIDEIVNN